MIGDFNLDHLKQSRPEYLEHDLRLRSVEQLVTLILSMLDKIKQLEAEINSFKVNYYNVILEYESGANPTEISKFLQQEFQINAHEAANRLRTHIIATEVSKEVGTELQKKLKDLHVKTKLVKTPFR